MSHEQNKTRGGEFKRRKKSFPQAVGKAINIYRTRQLLPMLCPSCQGHLLKWRQLGWTVTICGKCGTLNDIEVRIDEHINKAR
jgi:hypothetical protein